MRLSSTIGAMVVETSGASAFGVRPYPGFFAFSADIYALNHASPDGRRQAECTSYGVNPSTAVDTSPTSVLRSAANVAHSLCACGNPLAISLLRTDLASPDGTDLIRYLVTSYFAMGGMHVHINIVSADDLRAAKSNPEQYADLTVRVSGYSARFVTVEDRWQNALIERAEKGM